VSPIDTQSAGKKEREKAGAARPSPLQQLREKLRSMAGKSPKPSPSGPSSDPSSGSGSGRGGFFSPMGMRASGPRDGFPAAPRLSLSGRGGGAGKESFTSSGGSGDSGGSGNDGDGSSGVMVVDKD
jgi:hypothetical protein